MFITKKSVLFHASLPSFGRTEIKCGFLGKRSKKAPIAKFIKYWFVLRSNGIELYEDSTKLYYPDTTIHFRSVKSVELSVHTEYGIKVITGKNRFLFKADTEIQMKEWFNAIKSAHYNFQYAGDADVKIVLPFDAISDVFLQGDNSNSDAIGIKTIDQEFCFCYFTDINSALQTIRSLCPKNIQFSDYQVIGRPKTFADAASFTLGEENIVRGDSSPHLWPKMALDISNGEGNLSDSISPRPSPNSLELPGRKSTGDLAYPHIESSKKLSKRSSWWRSSGSRQDIDPETDNSFSLEKNLKFCKLFGFPDDEELLFTSSCYFERTVPLIGKFYFSANYLCFRTRLVGVQSRVVIPLSEVGAMEKEKSYFYYSVLVRAENEEEFVFDLPTSAAQEKCLALYQAKKQSAVLGRPTDLKTGSSESRPRAMTAAIVKPAFKHITLLTIGTRGDVQPYIALAKGLMADGHTIRIATHLEYKSWIESFGIEFREVKGDPAEIMKLVVDNGLFTPSMIREYLLHFTGWIEDLLYSIADAIEGTDILIESPSAIGGIHAAESKRIPYFHSFPFIWSKTKYYPHPFAILDRKTGGTYNYMTHVMAEQLMWKALRGIINRWRKDRLKLKPVGISVEDFKVPFLYSFSASVVPPPKDWPDWIHVCGYWFLDSPDIGWTPPEPLLNFMNSGSRPVYIGFGSIIVPDPDELTRTIIEAIQKAGIRAVISKGWSGRRPEVEQIKIEFPDSIFTLDSVPHDWLFPQMAAVVHHGGAGTTAAGFRAGLPTCIYPFFGDQFFWAARVDDLGVGTWIRKLTVDSLADALIKITTDQKVIEKSRILGEKIRNEKGVEVAIKMLYRDLEYAEKRIIDIADGHL